MSSDLYDIILNDPEKNIIFESGIFLSNAHVKRCQFDKHEIEIKDNSIVLPEPIQELCVYAFLDKYIANSTIICPNFPRLLSGFVQKQISTIIIPKYGPQYSTEQLVDMSLDELKIYIFQILVICIIFNKIGLKHNDLRNDNIVHDFIEDDDNENDNSSDDEIKKKIGLIYKYTDKEGNIKYYLIQTEIIYKVIDYEYSIIPESIPYSIEHNTYLVRGYNFNTKKEPSIDFLLFLLSIGTKFKGSIYSTNIKNKECYDYISHIFNKYYGIESFIEYVKNFDNRPKGDEIYKPLEPVLEEFESFRIDEQNEIINCSF